MKENRKVITIMPPDLALWLILISLNYPCVEHIFMVLKVFEPLKFTVLSFESASFCDHNHVVPVAFTIIVDEKAVNSHLAHPALNSLSTRDENS